MNVLRRSRSLTQQGLGGPLQPQHTLRQSECHCDTHTPSTQRGCHCDEIIVCVCMQKFKLGSICNSESVYLFNTHPPLGSVHLN